MKKKLYLSTTILLTGAMTFLSSCLKDSRYVDFSKGGTIVEFPLGGTPFFSAEAITDAGDTITKQFAVNIASVTVPTTSTTVNVAVDNSIVTSYNAANKAIAYEVMPTGSYVFTTNSVTVPAGQRSAVLSVTFYKDKLDPSKSYMLPIAIKSASDGGTISGNQGVMYYHFIGNDFAGTYEHYFDRWNVPDTTAAAHHDYDHVDEGPIIAAPVNPTEFTVNSSYYTGIPMHVTFTKTGSGPTAAYSNFNVFMTADDINAFFTGPSGGAVVLTGQPVIRSLHFNYNPSTQYTYAQSLLLFRFYYTTQTRAVIDTYVKQ